MTLPQHFGLRMGLFLLNLAVAAESLFIAITSTVLSVASGGAASYPHTRKSFRYMLLMTMQYLWIAFSLGFAILTWTTDRKVALLTMTNSIFFAFYAITYAAIAVYAFSNDNAVGGQAFSAFVFHALLGVTVCRIYGRRAQDDLDTADALAITREHMSV